MRKQFRINQNSFGNSIFEIGFLLEKKTPTPFKNKILIIVLRLVPDKKPRKKGGKKVESKFFPGLFWSQK